MAPLLAWLALLALLAATVTLAYVPLGPGNLIISLAIAGLKTAIIGLVFMRLARSTSLYWLAAGTGPLMVFILFLLMGTDYLTR